MIGVPGSSLATPASDWPHPSRQSRQSDVQEYDVRLKLDRVLQCRKAVGRNRITWPHSDASQCRRGHLDNLRQSGREARPGVPSMMPPAETSTFSSRPEGGTPFRLRSVTN